jgi:hypothetical protein
MTVSISSRTRQSLQKVKKEPSIVLEFDGIAQRFGSARIFKNIKIGDAGLVIGNAWVIGGQTLLENQLDAITFSSEIGSTTSKIDYRLNPDLGLAEGITSLQVALVEDKANTILGLLANNEFLARKCRVLLSPDPNDTTFPDDYIVIFRGIVDDIQLPAGGVVFNISHPDQKKRQQAFVSAEGELSASMNNSQTTVPLSTGEGANFLVPITGPDGSIDASFKSYVRIDNEIIRYTGESTDTLTSCTRAQLSTTAASHADEASVKSFYRLEGNPITLALKLMLSGWNGPFVEDVAISTIQEITGPVIIPNALFFNGVNVSETYGITEGDYVTVSGAANGANNFTLREITSVVVLGDGSSYVIVEGAALVTETTTSAVCAFRSKYDTLPSGLKMSPDEVDVAEHERLTTLFLSGISYDIYIKDTIDGRDFIAEELYKPIACYAVPRKARASLAYTIGPLPTQIIKTLDTTNVKNAERISKRRSIGRNFYNTIIYKFAESALEDEFLRGFLATDTDSRDQIKLDTRAFTVITKGLRDSNVIQSAATRRLDRYKFAATSINNVRVTFDTGFDLEVADLVIVDGESLKFANTDTGQVGDPKRFYEIISKSVDLRTGDVTLGLLDTNFGDAGRYALISPASYILSGSSQTQFQIQSSFSSEFGLNEFEKWLPFTAPVIRVRSEDYSVAATATISAISGNTISVTPALGFTPSAGYLMELGNYDNATDQIKLLYTHISSATGANFGDGGKTYVMI